MKTATAKTIKNKYLSIKNEGQEIYAEALPLNSPFEADQAEAKMRLTLLKRAMPKGMPQVNIEAEYSDESYKTLAHFE